MGSVADVAMDAADAAAPNHEGGKPVIRSDVL